jgi:hypothetical protein
MEQDNRNQEFKKKMNTETPATATQRSMQNALGKTKKQNKTKPIQ